MKVYSFIPEKAREKIHFFALSSLFLHFPRNEQANPRRNRPGRSILGQFRCKIMIYYTIIIRRNQHLFATFHFKIAGLCIAHFTALYSEPFLVISYNSLFFNGFPTGCSKKIMEISFLFPSVYREQTFRVLLFSGIPARWPVFGSVAVATKRSISCKV